MSAKVINLTIEKLIRDWLNGEEYTFALNFYTGTDSGTGGNDPARQLPCCVVECESAQERIKGVGLYDIQCSVTVIHSADDTLRTSHEIACGEVLDYLTNQDGIDLFNQTVAAHIYDIFPAQIQTGRDGRNWTATMSLQMAASLSNLGV
jgi:hypothetical protein